MAKAMVLKRAGDPLGAAQAMEDARLLDGQDRFLNGKAAKYWLRAGDVRQAEELLALFTKASCTAHAGFVLTLSAEGCQRCDRSNGSAMFVVLTRGWGRTSTEWKSRNASETIPSTHQRELRLPRCR